MTKLFSLKSSCCLIAAVMVMGISFRSAAAGPGGHPAYLHALEDLRGARWMIDHRPGNWKQTADEMAAVKFIDGAIDEIKKAAIDDGKNINDHPQMNEKPDRAGRLHDAMDYLKRARMDIGKDPDAGFGGGLRDRALKHIDGALHATEKAFAAK